MDPFKSNHSSNGKAQSGHQVNPFARALAETEQRSSQSASSFANSNGELQNSLNSSNSNLLNPAFSGQDNSLFNGVDYQKQMEQQQEDLKKKQMREKLHRMINPVEQTDIFSAREEKRKKDINKVREDLKALAEEIAMFYKEIDISLTQEVVSPGQSGVYHENFFDKLRQFIQMIRQRVRSARTWAQQAKRKQQKKRHKFGLDFSNQEAKSAHDMMHHERSNAFGA